MQGLELAYFEDQSTGGLMAILNDDVNQLERFLDVGANNMIRTLTNVVLVGIVFLIASPLLALVAFLPIPVILWGSFRYQRRLEPLYRGVRDQVGRLSGTLANNLGGIATIKAFTAEERETERVGRESEAYRVANKGAIRFSSAFVPLIRIAILFGFTMTLLVGGRAVIDGNLQVGFFSVLVFMTQRLLWPLTTLGETFDLYQRAMASTRRILDLLAVRPRVIEGGGRLPRPPAGAVRFEDVRFAYSSGPEVLRGLDIEVPAGETHAVVGLTGAGKSTVVKLLLRLYDATGGRVTVDGIDVRELSFTELRGVIGLVSQDVFLFDGSVRENIAYGDPAASAGHIEEAARLAEAHEFIAALPEGYDTIVGERGQKLSGGPAPAPVHRPGDRARPRHPGARRGHLRRGQRDRGRDPALPGARRPRPHHAGHRPPALHGARRPPDPRAGARRRDRVGHPRRAGRDGRALRRPVARSDRGGRPHRVAGSRIVRDVAVVPRGRHG